MENQKKKLDENKAQAAIQILQPLKEKLYCGDVSKARRAAHHLSWLQEDGLEILKSALLSDAQGSTKNAAGYGLRHMHGRMKKPALEVLRQGLTYPNPMTRDISKRALEMAARK